MKKKIFGIIVLFIMLVSSLNFVILVSADSVKQTSTSNTGLTVEKYVACLGGEGWFKEVTLLGQGTVQFLIKIINDCGADIDNLVVTDILPFGLEYVPDSSSIFEPIIVENNLIWAFGPPLQNCEIQIIRFNVFVSTFGEHINRVNVTGDAGVTVYGEDVATVYSTEPPSVAIHKWIWDPDADNGQGDWVDEHTIEFADEARFKIRIHNDGPNTIFNIVVNDILPLGLQYSGVADPIPEINGNLLTWRYDSIKKWHIKEIEFNVKGADEGARINTANVTADRFGYFVYDEDNAILNVGPKPNLHCDGTLFWNDIKAGTTVYSSITIKNMGTPGSKLDWEVESYPEWGTWDFYPSSGEDLEYNNPVTVTVTLTSPNQQKYSYYGDVVIVNTKDDSDKCTISVTLRTPRTKYNFFINIFLEKIFEDFPILQRLLNI